MTTTTTPASIKLYGPASLPRHWIVDADGEFFILPVLAEGWAQRRSLPAHQRALIDGLSPSNLAIHGRSLGLPKTA